MSKVILTQEQAEIIEETKFALAGFSNDILVRCLNGEYEVGLEFKVGDKVALEIEGVICVMGEITSLDKEDGVTYANVVDSKYLVPQRVSVNALHHPTPSEIAEEKECRWWNGYGRGAWELRKGDILYNSWLGIRTVFYIQENGKVSFAECHKVYEIDEIKKSYRVACFAESRLDVKEDE